MFWAQESTVIRSNKHLQHSRDRTSGQQRLPSSVTNLNLNNFFMQVDLAVIEVGIGGAYDCTNIIR